MSPAPSSEYLRRAREALDFVADCDHPDLRTAFAALADHWREQADAAHVRELQGEAPPLFVVLAPSQNGSAAS